MSSGGTQSLEALASLSGLLNFTPRRVAFVPAKFPDKTPIPEGFDVVHLNPGVHEEVMPAVSLRQLPLNPVTRNGTEKKKELWKQADILLSWKSITRAGLGLQNLGNTCFMNSVLQCLTHTPPLANALLSGLPLGSANEKNNALRITQRHMSEALKNPGRSLAPRAHFNTLRKVCRSFRPGRQEDAHEYLVALLDAMHESSLWGVKPKPPREVAETSLIYCIFSGKICSQVKCTQCGYESNTFEPFLDISLEINRAGSVEKALERFTCREYLDGENKYRCEKEDKLVKAVKCITIDQPPNVLVLQLKRFEFTRHGRKVTKKVDFGNWLDLRPFMRDNKGVPVKYQLYGVLVHSGPSVHSGHYYCYVKGPNGLWHQMDDDHVTQVSEQVVMQQNAYILFYIRHLPEKRPMHPVSPPTCQSHPLLRQQPTASPCREKPVTDPKKQVHSHAGRDPTRIDASRLSHPPAEVPGPSCCGSDGEPTPNTPPQGPELAGSTSFDSDSLDDRQASHAQASGPGQQPQKKASGFKFLHAATAPLPPLSQRDPVVMMLRPRHFARFGVLSSPCKVYGGRSYSRLQTSMLCMKAKAAEKVHHGLSPAGSPARIPEGKPLRIASPLGRQSKAPAESSPPQVAPSVPVLAKALSGPAKATAELDPPGTSRWPDQTSAGRRPGKRRRFAALSRDEEQHSESKVSGSASQNEVRTATPSCDMAPVSAWAPETRRTTDPKEVLAFLEGPSRDSLSQRESHGIPLGAKRGRQYDEYEQEYDRGKTKKVRNHDGRGLDAWDHNGKEFQRFAEKGQRGRVHGRGHHHGSRVKSGGRHGHDRARGPVSRSWGGQRHNGHKPGSVNRRGRGHWRP